MIDQELKKRVEARFSTAEFPAPYAKPLNLEFTRFQVGGVTAEVVVREEWSNPWGIAHGGFLFTLLDEILGTGASTVTDDARYEGITSASTINHEIYFHSPAFPGERLTISSSVIKAGRRIIAMQGEIRKTADSKLVATSKGLWFINR